MDPATQGVPGYFVWQTPGQPVVIHLSLDVVDRMASEILRGFGAVPKRGAEMGGILLGDITPGSPRGDVPTIRIEGFEPVPCNYVRGPSYLLTDDEKTLFAEVCQRRSKEIVGYYRGHTREGLTLHPEDLELLDRHFSSSSQVALLVKPFATKPSVAGFFARKNGVFPAATPLEFPFRRGEMTGEEPALRPTLQEGKPPQQEPPPQTPAPGHEPIFSAGPNQPPNPNAPPRSRTGMWMVAAFVFLLLGVLLGYEASRITPPQGASEFALSLAVERTGENLTVHWNPHAAAVRSASNGVLEIDDGGEIKRVELDRANLSGGSLVYRNGSDKVRFRLVLYLDSGLSVTEMLDWPR